MAWFELQHSRTILDRLVKLLGQKKSRRSLVPALGIRWILSYDLGKSLRSFGQISNSHKLEALAHTEVDDLVPRRQPARPQGGLSSLHDLLVVHSIPQNQMQAVLGRRRSTGRRGQHLQLSDSIQALSSAHRSAVAHAEASIHTAPHSLAQEAAQGDGWPFEVGRPDLGLQPAGHLEVLLPHGQLEVPPQTLRIWCQSPHPCAAILAAWRCRSRRASGRLRTDLWDAREGCTGHPECETPEASSGPAGHTTGPEHPRAPCSPPGCTPDGSTHSGEPHSSGGRGCRGARRGHSRRGPRERRGGKDGRRGRPASNHRHSRGAGARHHLGCPKWEEQVPMPPG
mmetsp:Transcript_129718/g.416114  ORF Transcript_129718/g.416114 Transcript_129718/m.416114 type:complete len:340 (+) Transcript_129718:757-1776(+)